jgi:hypothetical protein
MSRGTGVKGGVGQDDSEIDPRTYAWRSTQRFTGRLRLAVAEVGEQAVKDRHLARAVRVMTLMVANAGLAQEIVDGLPSAEWTEVVV